MAARLLRCRTRWRPFERQACIRAAAPRRRRDATATRLLRVRNAVVPVGASSAAAAGLYGEWRGYSKSCFCAGKRRFRTDQVTRRDSLARSATFDNRRLAAAKGSQMAWSVTTDVAVS